jgi:GT2 family glycosyltransferase
MVMTEGRILVVLPTLGDRLEMLEETLASVSDQRSQVDLGLVVIVPVEASRARTLASQYGAQLVDDPREGISTAINRGLLAAGSERYYAWIGDDDLFRPGGLLLLRTLMERNPENIVSYGACDYIDEEGRIIARSKAGRWAPWMQPWGPNLIPHPGSLLRIDAMRAVGWFDPSLRYAMDLDMFLKLRHLGRFVSTKQSVSAFRWHADSLTVGNRQASSAESEAIKRRHLPAMVRPVSPLWDIPVRWASARAATTLNSRAERLRRVDAHG